MFVLAGLAIGAVVVVVVVAVSACMLSSRISRAEEGGIG